MIRLYNTLSNQKEDFVPREEGRVRMYNCGPTVYNFIHIGNLRSFLLADLLRRVLELEGYQVDQVMNITDVGHLQDDDVADCEGEDKLQKQAALEKLDAWQVAERYAQAFFEDIEALRFRKAHVYPKATEHIPEMIEMIQKLQEKGIAYEVDGEVYFDLSRFPDYGKLSGNTQEELQAGARVAVDSKKRSAHDFALWKYDPKHQMKWDSPWSEGFPGWHIECSAMSQRYLGPELDIHTGGEDNIFPHHECEIAQSEATNDVPFVRYWVHARFLLVDGEKMSKSKGNFYTVRDLLGQGHSPEALRYALLSNHYRQPQNFTMEVLSAAKRSVERLQDLVDRLREEPRREGALSSEVQQLAEKAEADFRESLRDDLETPNALAAVFGLLKEANARQADGTLNGEDVERLLQSFQLFNQVFDVLNFQEQAVPDQVLRMLEERQQARQDKEWARSDALRDAILELGYAVKDTKDGVRLTPVEQA